MEKFYITKASEGMITRFRVTYSDITGRVTVSQPHPNPGNGYLLSILAQCEELLSQIHIHQYKTNDPLELLQRYYRQRGWATWNPKALSQRLK